MRRVTGVRQPAGQSATTPVAETRYCWTARAQSYRVRQPKSKAQVAEPHCVRIGQRMRRVIGFCNRVKARVAETCLGLRLRRTVTGFSNLANCEF